MAFLAPAVPLLAAGIGAGASIYTADKQAKQAEQALEQEKLLAAQQASAEINLLEAQEAQSEQAALLEDEKERRKRGFAATQTSGLGGASFLGGQTASGKTLLGG